MIQLHVLCDHHRFARALRLMFTHYFIVISVNLITVAFHFLNNTEAGRTSTAGLMTAALLIFFISIYCDSAYYDDRFRFAGRDIGICAVSLAAAAALMFAAGSNTYLFLFGELIAAGGNFCLLFGKYNEGKNHHAD